jgi:hypothetical protein
MSRLIPSPQFARLAFPSFRYYMTLRFPTNLPAALPFGSFGRTTPRACFHAALRIHFLFLNDSRMKA